MWCPDSGGEIPSLCVEVGLSQIPVHFPESRTAEETKLGAPAEAASPGTLPVAGGLPRSLRPWFPWEVSAAVPSVGGQGGAGGSSVLSSRWAGFHRARTLCLSSLG